MRRTISDRALRALVAIALAAGGCSAELGYLALVTPERGAPATKLLRPGVEGRECRSAILGMPTSPSDAPPIDAALAHILSLDAEGNAIANAEVRSESLLTGIYNRRCVVVRGDLVRTIRTVTIPIPGGHQHAH
jgi:hypothetical protein